MGVHGHVALSCRNIVTPCLVMPDNTCPCPPQSASRRELSPPDIQNPIESSIQSRQSSDINNMEHIMFYLPTLRILSIPHDFLSYYPDRFVNTVINIVFTFIFRFVPASRLHGLGEKGCEWLLRCWAYCNSVLISLEQAIRPLGPFQPLFELCWFDTCWYLKDTAPFLLASRSSDQVWLSTELLAWIAVTLGVIHLGVLIVKLALQIVRFVSYILRCACACCSSRQCAGVPTTENLSEAETTSSSSLTIEGHGVNDTKSVSLSTEVKVPEAETKQSSALQSEEQHMAATQPVNFSTEDRVACLVSWLVGFLVGWLVYSCT